MKSDNTARVFAGLFLITAVLLFLNSCTRHRVPLRKPSGPPPKGVFHVVERHQTLYRICKTYGVDLKSVAFLNRIPDDSKIEVGQRIFIPGARKRLRVEIYIDDVVEESAPGEKEKIPFRTSDFIWPVEGLISEGFQESERKRHEGIDIPSRSGTPVKASNFGNVVYCGNTIKGYGNMVILRHPGEWVTVYAHNEVNLVQEGAAVVRGQVIARVGQTGRASGPHLHFEVRHNNKAVDPMLLLNRIDSHAMDHERIGH